MKYLVTREDAVIDSARTGATIRTSALWPVVVEAVDSIDAVEQSYKVAGWEAPGGTPRSFLVSPLCSADKVTFSPRRTYDVKIEPYESTN